MSLVRPHVVYCVHAGMETSCTERYKVTIKVQHRITRMLLGYKHIPYEDRLTKLALLTLQQRQLEMWVNAQRDGRPAEYRWCPLFNAAKFG